MSDLSITENDVLVEVHECGCEIRLSPDGFRDSGCSNHMPHQSDEEDEPE